MVCRLPALQGRGCQQEGGHAAECPGAHGPASGLRLHPDPAGSAWGSLAQQGSN